MKYLKVQKEKNVLRVQLARPEKHNAFTSEMIQEVTEVFQGAKADGNLRVVVLSGEGKSFCAGADIEWMRASVQYDLEKNKNDASRLFSMFESVALCPVPVLARVHGSVMGGGLGLVAAADIVAAETETKFSFSEARLGIIPAVISPFVLRKSGMSGAMETMLTAEVFGVAKAKELNLIHFFGENDEAADFVQSRVDYILANGPGAVRQIKKLINEIGGRSLESVRPEVVDAIARKRVDPEGQEGLRAFLEKRTPTWKGE